MPSNIIYKKDINVVYIVLFAIGLLFLFIQNVYAATDLDKHIETSFQTTYNNNVNSDSSSKNDDLIQSIFLGLKLNEKDKRGETDILTSIVQNYYLKNESFNYSEKKVNVNYKKTLFIDDRIYCSDAFTHNQEAQGFVNVTEKISERYAYYHNKFEGAYYKTFFSKFDELMFSYSNEIYFPVDSIANNWIFHKASIELNHVFNTYYHGFIGYEYKNKVFSRGSIGTANNAYIGFKKNFNKRSFFLSRVGYSCMQPFGNKEINKPFFIALFAHDISMKSKLNISFKQESIFSYGTKDVLTLWDATFFVTHNLSKKLNVNLTQSWGENTYSLFDVHDKTMGFKIGLDYVVNDKMNMQVAYDYSSVDSSSESRSYNKNLYTIRLVYTF